MNNKHQDVQCSDLSKIQNGPTDGLGFIIAWVHEETYTTKD